MTPKQAQEKDEKLQEKVEVTAVYCQECQKWLNGPRQWEDHKIGKKHRKNVQKGRQGKNPKEEVPNATTPKKEVVQKPDPTPDRKSDMWDWLENAKKEKEERKEGEGV